MRGTTKRPEVKTVNPGEQARTRRRARRKGLDARRRKQEERPPARTKKEREQRKVARAVGESLEFRHPETADDDDRLVDGNESASSKHTSHLQSLVIAGSLFFDRLCVGAGTEEHRSALGFPAGAVFGVAVPKRNVSQFAKRPSTAPIGRGSNAPDGSNRGFLSRPIQINETLPRGQAAPRNRPIGDASARLAAIDHRQAQLRAMATGAATQEDDVHFHHTADGNPHLTLLVLT